jgi:predicted DCC family thiol-disulfide oxidoreductase YuxK
MNIVLFDGVCNFCNATVLKIIKYDKQNKIKFASQQSAIGQKLLFNYKVINNNIETIYFINHDEKIFTESDAVFEILKLLNGIPRIALLFLIIPKFIRNYLYRLIAKNRYKWFGRKQECSIPTPEFKDKFLY